MAYITVPTTFEVSGEPLEVGETATVSIQVEHTGTGDADLFTARFIVDGTLTETKQEGVSTPSLGSGINVVEFDVSFSTAGQHTVAIEILGADNQEKYSKTITVGDEETAAEEAAARENTFSDNRPPVTLTNITSPKASFGKIEFGKYDQPDISIDTGIRYAKHEVIAGPTVRQRVGQDQTEININGVCTEEVANRVDLLRYEDTISMESSRGSFAELQVVTTSTQPHSEGGTIDYNGEFLHTFSISLVEVS